MLREKQFVTVVAPQSYKASYKTLFDNYGFVEYENYETLKSALSKLVKLTYEQERQLDMSARNITRVAEELFEQATSQAMPEKFKWLLASDHVIIDDALDHDDEDDPVESFISPPIFVAAVLLKMKLAERFYPEKIVWAVMDSYIRDSWYRFYKGQCGHCTQEQSCDEHKTGQEVVDMVVRGPNAFGCEESAFSVKMLTKVMRCSQNVFSAAYGQIPTESLASLGT